MQHPNCNATCLPEVPTSLRATAPVSSCCSITEGEHTEEEHSLQKQHELKLLPPDVCDRPNIQPACKGFLQ